MFKTIILWGLMALALLIQSSAVQAQTDDIPTCPYASGVFYQPNHLPRYDFDRQRVVIVDLVTREEVRELATGISAQNYWVQSWSPECQYLSMAFSRTDERDIEYWDTLIWDVVNGGEIGRFEGARLVPFPMTWDTNSTQILVETRFGAYLWKLGGSQVWLTADGDYNGRSFRQGTLNWDYANNQLSGVLTIPPLGSALYDMATGELLAITNQWGEPIATDSNLASLADGDGERYRCVWNGPEGLRVIYNVPTDRLLLQDRNTHDVVSVLEENVSELVESTVLISTKWANDCRLLMVNLRSTPRSRGDFMVYNIETNQRLLLFSDDATPEQAYIDPTGQYMVIQVRSGLRLYHLNTGESFPLAPDLTVTSRSDGPYLIWDVENNRVTILHNRYYQVHDIHTGRLLQLLHSSTKAEQPLELLERVETRRTVPYGCNWSTRYETDNQRLVLRRDQNIVAVVEDNLIAERITQRTVSPDCRYLAGYVDNGDESQYVVWDLVTHTRAYTFNDLRVQAIWETDHAQRLIETDQEMFLWHMPSDVLIPLAYGARGFRQWEWDFDNGMLWAVPVERSNTVIGYDINTGAVMNEYHLEGSGATRFNWVSDDRIFLYPAWRLPQSEKNYYALWSLDGTESYQLKADRSIQRTGTPLFSPDGSKLLLYSQYYVSIWDLNQLVGDAPHAPNYRFRVVNPYTAQFEDDNTLVTRLNISTRYHFERRLLQFAYYRYDVATGLFLSETVETVPEMRN